MKNRLAITLLVIFVSHLLVFDIWGYWMVYGPYPKPLVVCKVCHCGKEKCNRVCSVVRARVGGSDEWTVVTDREDSGGHHLLLSANFAKTSQEV